MRSIKTIILYAMVGCVVGLALAGCSSEPEPEEAAPTLRFQVVDSLLRPPVELAELDLYFRPPRNFTPPTDSLAQLFKTQLAGREWEYGELVVIHSFVHPELPAGILISRITSASLDGDTARLFAMYRDILRHGQQQTTIREGEFWVNEVFTKNFLITDSLNVRFQLICLSDHFHGAEFIYYASRQTYPRIVRYIESSIGSIERIHKGGSP